MGARQDIFSLITDRLRYFLQADSSLYLVSVLPGVTSWRPCWSGLVSPPREVAVRLVRLANNLGFNSGPPDELESWWWWEAWVDILLTNPHFSLQLNTEIWFVCWRQYFGILRRKILTINIYIFLHWTFFFNQLKSITFPHPQPWSMRNNTERYTHIHPWWEVRAGRVKTITHHITIKITWKTTSPHLLNTSAGETKNLNISEHPVPVIPEKSRWELGRVRAIFN